MSQQATEILRAFSPRKIFLPIGIGLAAATYLLLRNFDRSAFSNIDWTWHSSMWIFVSFLMVGVRDALAEDRHLAADDQQLRVEFMRVGRVDQVRRHVAL